jgi:hypothetical protein
LPINHNLHSNTKCKRKPQKKENNEWEKTKTHVSNAVSLVIVDGSVWILLFSKDSLMQPTTQQTHVGTKKMHEIDHPHTLKRVSWPNSRGRVQILLV